MRKMTVKNQLKTSEYTLTKQNALNTINSTKNLRDRCILKSLYYGGMRASEVIQLRVEDIDFENNTINIISGKGNKTRKIPFIDSGFKADLRYHIGGKRRGELFLLGRKHLWKICVEAGKQAGVSHPMPGKTNINPHLFRHSIARHLKTDGWPWEFIQNFLGHSSFKTTMDTYGTMGFDEMQQIALRRDPSLRNRRDKMIGEVQM